MVWWYKRKGKGNEKLFSAGGWQWLWFWGMERGWATRPVEYLSLFWSLSISLSRKKRGREEGLVHFPSLFGRSSHRLFGIENFTRKRRHGLMMMGESLVWYTVSLQWSTCESQTDIWMLGSKKFAAFKKIFQGLLWAKISCDTHFLNAANLEPPKIIICDPELDLW